MRKTLGHILMLSLLAAFLGCAPGRVPTRHVDYHNARDVFQAFQDYRWLERTGVEAVRLKGKYFNHTVSIAYYLFSLGQALERFGRDSAAAKLYLRLLTTYPVIHEGGQLGIMAENRLRWLIGDKSWLDPSLDDLILRIEHALRTRNEAALGRLMSRDFGFGRSYQDRFAVKYQDGLQLIASELPELVSPTVEVVANNGDDQVMLKITGWDKGNLVWYFSLHKNVQHGGWEWDQAYWEQKPGYDLLSNVVF